MKSAYTYVVIRYIHDVVSGEFVNVGVALYASSTGFLQTKCTEKYGRLSKMFLHVDGTHYRSIMKYVQQKSDEMQQRLAEELSFERPEDAADVLRRFIPADDSSLQISNVSGGITSDPLETLEMLYERYVEQYVEKGQHRQRNDEDVWRVFRSSLDKAKIARFFRPHCVLAKDYEYEFDHAWKNGQWQVLKPISFDLEDSASVRDKATKWLGRGTALHEANDPFKMYLLLGTPSRPELAPAFQSALNLLNQIPVEKEIGVESQAEVFAEEMQRQIELHLSE